MRMTWTAKQAHERAAPGEGVIGWRLEPVHRDELIERFPPRYGKTIADHVTLSAKVARDSELPSETSGKIVGRSDDGKGVEALVVRIGGTSDRPDWSSYHITWSLEEGREARESNEVIARHGWKPIEPPVPIALRPEHLR